jgi:hypothetical protein
MAAVSTPGPALMDALRALSYFRRISDKGDEDMMVRRAGRVGAALAIGLIGLGLSVAPAAGDQAAEHFVEDVTGDTIQCETEIYEITSGTIKTTIHEGESQSGNHNITGTLTPQKVVAVDADDNEYAVRGAFWFGGTFNDQRASQQSTFTGKLQIVEKATGSVDSVNVTFHVNAVDGVVTNIKGSDFGTCEA